MAGGVGKRSELDWTRGRNNVGNETERAGTTGWDGLVNWRLLNDVRGTGELWTADFGGF
jgi:hypothetical protein